MPELVIQVDAVLQDSEKLKALSKVLINDLKEYINAPTVMPINEFAKREGISKAQIQAHRQDYCVIQFQPNGKLYINMLAWREKLQGR